MGAKEDWLKAALGIDVPALRAAKGETEFQTVRPSGGRARSGAVIGGHRGKAPGGDSNYVSQLDGLVPEQEDKPQATGYTTGSGEGDVSGEDGDSNPYAVSQKPPPVNYSKFDPYAVVTNDEDEDEDELSMLSVDEDDEDISEIDFDSDSDSDSDSDYDDDDDDDDDDEPAPKQKRVVDKAFIEEMKKKKITPKDIVSTENPHGFKTQQLGKAYVGEHEKAQWRNWTAEGSEDKNIRTKHYTDEERAKKTLDIDSKGRVRDAKGEKYSTGGHSDGEYVLDPETGKLMTFTQTREAISRDGRRRNAPSITDVQNAVARGEQVEVTHHSSVLAGKDVANAGGIEVYNGEISKISNASGHYKPKLVQMIQTVEHLMKQGAMLDHDLTDADGNDLEESNPRAYKLYREVGKRQKKIAEYSKYIGQFEKQLDQAGEDQAKVKRVATNIEKLEGMITTLAKEIEQGVKMLNKLGVGPSMKPDKYAKVEFTEGKEGMDGLQFRFEAKTRTMDPEQFLKTGGSGYGSDEYQNKSEMLKELEEKTAKKRETLDMMAEKRARRVGSGSEGPSEEDLAGELAKLRGEDPEKARAKVRRKQPRQGPFEEKGGQTVTMKQNYSTFDFTKMEKLGEDSGDGDDSEDQSELSVEEERVQTMQSYKTFRQAMLEDSEDDSSEDDSDDSSDEEDRVRPMESYATFRPGQEEDGDDSSEDESELSVGEDQVRPMESYTTFHPNPDSSEDDGELSVDDNDEPDDSPEEGDEDDGIIGSDGSRMVRGADGYLRPKR